MKRNRVASLLMAMALSVGLMGCTAANQTQATPQVTTSQEEVQGEEVRLAVISGPTGIGAAKLLTDSDRGETVNHYTYTIASDNNEVVSGLTSQEGEFDIAMVASNMAANLYNKTDGDVRILALGTQGVLHILEGSGGTAIQSMADLKGKTIYATGQGANPEYVLSYLLTENGVDPADVDIQWMTGDEITALMASGEAELCMLPVPAATAVQMKNADVREALDLSAEWDSLQNGSRLTMTTIVARTEFVEENPQAVENFLADYAASVDYVNGNPAEAAELVAGYGITANAQIAQAAIPKCALVCITGASEMRGAIQGYYEVLYQANPDAIGGGIPDDAFYYQG